MLANNLKQDVLNLHRRIQLLRQEQHISTSPIDRELINMQMAHYRRLLSKQYKAYKKIVNKS